MLRLHWRRLRSKYPWIQMFQTWRFWVVASIIVMILLYTILAFKKTPIPYIMVQMYICRYPWIQMFQTWRFWVVASIIVMILLYTILAFKKTPIPYIMVKMYICRYPWIQMFQTWRFWVVASIIVMILLYTILAFKKTPIPYIMVKMYICRYPWIQMFQTWRFWVVASIIVMILLYTILAFKKTPIPYIMVKMYICRYPWIQMFQTWRFWVVASIIVMILLYTILAFKKTPIPYIMVKMYICRYPWIQMFQTWRFWVVASIIVMILLYTILAFKKTPFPYIMVKMYICRYPWVQMFQTWRFWVVASIIVMILLYTILAFKKTPIPYIMEEIHNIKLGQMEFDFQTGLYFLTKDKNVYLRGSMPDLLHMNGSPTQCSVFNISKEFCAMWYGQVKLQVIYSQDQHASCYDVEWQPTTQDYQPQTCFSLADYKWFGGSLLYDQVWPVNTANVPFQSFQTQDLRYYQGAENVFGNVLDYFWISSAGVAVMVDHSYPLYVSVNQSRDNLLCLYSVSDDRPSLKYRICKSDNIRKIHRYVISQMVDLPKSLPTDDFFTKPFWSTSPYIYDNLNQDKIHKYGVDIHKHFDSKGNVIDIFDDSLAIFKKKTFSENKYMNMHQVIMYLHEYKFKVCMPVSPFVTTTEDWSKSQLMLDSNGNPLETTWNDEDVHLLNLLDSDTFDWFVESLRKLKEQFKVDGFRFVGGESVYLTLKNVQPAQMNKYSSKLSEVMHVLRETSLSTFASHSQSGSNFIVLSSLESSWNTKGGLASVIPSVFTLGMLGYPFVIPNVIGGPGQSVRINSTHTEQKIPERELYIRWLGLSAYMPGMMFSVPPWMYDEEVVKIAKHFTDVHGNTVGPLVFKAAREYEISGSPIIRPLWWLDPQDKNLLTITDEYLIGDSLLVAPIITKGATHRDIYIPDGAWRDELRGVDIVGKEMLKDYKIELGQVASFTRKIKAI